MGRQLKAALSRRTTKWELMEYFTELTQTDAVDFFRPNLWPNTPDILPYHLQHKGPAAFMARLVLAGTLGATYGIYGPAFELQENAPFAPGREEDQCDSGEEFHGHLRSTRKSYRARVGASRTLTQLLRFLRRRNLNTYHSRRRVPY